jgi:hypothetical protein
MEFLEGCNVAASIILKSNRGVFAIDTQVQSVVADAVAPPAPAPDPAAVVTDCLLSKGLAEGLVDASISSKSQ